MSQFSMRSSGMRAKCRTLPVTSVASRCERDRGDAQVRFGDP
jgi:hypothetical protein